MKPLSFAAVCYVVVDSQYREPGTGPTAGDTVVIAMVPALMTLPVLDCWCLSRKPWPRALQFSLSDETPLFLRSPRS